ncbi:MAG: phosphodiester glycosidase family protein [Bacteroidales bacterium]|nr:phosphodiester glycosidase family protein [Candidatus Colimorpha onthohippi]
MNRLLFALFLICTVGATSCTTRTTIPETYDDSTTFAQANGIPIPAESLKCTQYQFKNLFGAPQTITILEIDSSQRNRIHLASDTILTTTDTLAMRFDALAAINGSYFDMVNGNPICYLRINNKELGINVPQFKTSIHRKYYQYASLCISSNQLLITVPDSAINDERSMPYPNIMTAGPMLRNNNQDVPQKMDRTFVTQRHNRTALGIRQDGSIVLVVADGRFYNEAQGLTLPQLVTLMRWLGCVDAINLDGGGSTTMYLRRQGIINYPSDNGQFDHAGTRYVSSIIYVK